MQNGHIGQGTANQLMKGKMRNVSMSSEIEMLKYTTVGKSLRLTSKNSMAVILGQAWMTSITTVFT